MIGSPTLLDQFEAPKRLRALGGAYLCSNSMGIVPRSAIEAERQCVQQQCERGIDVWDSGEWSKILDDYCAVIGRYVGVSADQVCPVTNITDGIWRVLSAIPLRQNPVILQTSMEFTTQLYANHGFEAFGANVVTVPSDEANHLVPTERIIRAITTHRPAVVHISHAAFESSYLHEVSIIGQACREVGAVFLLDAAQTGFVLPLNMADLCADVLLLQQHKWGCAGTGAASIVATRAFIENHEPGLVGWMSHGNTWAFEKGPATFGKTAWRFAGGTPDVPSKARGKAAAEIIVDQLGIHAVYAHNQALVNRLLEGLSRIAERSPHHAQGPIRPILLARRAGFVAIECGSTDRAKAIEHALRERHIVIDSRGPRLRVGATFYNHSNDIDVLLSALGELTEKGF